MSRSVIVLGKGTLAVRICEWFQRSPDYELTHIVPVVPEPAWTDSLIEWAEEHSVPTIESGHWRDLPLEGKRTADLGLSVFYDKILGPSAIRRFGRLLNLHNSPLPRYRGIAPINWALKNGEHSHGVTIHEITPGVDDGPIVSQLTYSIYPEFDEVIDVYRRGLDYGWTLFQQTMPILDRIVARSQDPALATSYSSRDAERLGDRRQFTRALSTQD